MIQSPGCHSGADTRAVSWISVPFLIHTHLRAEKVNLANGTKRLDLSTLSVHFSGPRIAPLLVQLKEGEGQGT